MCGALILYYISVQRRKCGIINREMLREYTSIYCVAQRYIITRVIKEMLVCIINQTVYYNELVFVYWKNVVYYLVFIENDIFEWLLVLCWWFSVEQKLHFLYYPYLQNVFQQTSKKTIIQAVDYINFEFSSCKNSYLNSLG